MGEFIRNGVGRALSTLIHRDALDENASLVG